MAEDKVTVEEASFFIFSSTWREVKSLNIPIFHLFWSTFPSNLLQLKPYLAAVVNSVLRGSDKWSTQI